MGIQIDQGMRGLSFYQDYHRPEVKQVSESEVKRQDQMLQDVSYTFTDASSGSGADSSNRRVKNADIENISLTFNKEESYGYLGSESRLEMLDVRKAVSDMRKDGVLQEYQYFVGNSQNFAFQSEDGVVIPKF